MEHLSIVSIDDDPVFLFLLESFLEVKQFTYYNVEAEFFDKSKEYFDSLSTTDIGPDLILLDLNMPVMNGFEFMDKYLEKGYDKKFPNTKVFILTSSLSNKDKIKAYSYYIVEAFIEKRPDKAMVNEILENYERKSRKSNKINSRS